MVDEWVCSALWFYGVELSRHDQHPIIVGKSKKDSGDGADNQSTLLLVLVSALSGNYHPVRVQPGLGPQSPRQCQPYCSLIVKIAPSMLVG